MGGGTDNFDAESGLCTDYDVRAGEQIRLRTFAGFAPLFARSALRRDSVAQIAANGDLAEYFEPFTGKPLGSPQQSWTAAVALDWLARDDGEAAPSRFIQG